MSGGENNRSDPALLGILCLLASECDPTAQPPTEVLLARVGLSYDEIGLVVDKSAEAVRKAATRAGITKAQAKKAGGKVKKAA